MVVLVPAGFLSCAKVPLNDGEDGVVYGNPSIHYAIILAPKSLDGFKKDGICYLIIIMSYLIYGREVKAIPKE